MCGEAQAILDELGFHLPADATLGDLTIGQQQLVATARAAMPRHPVPDLRRADRLSDAQPRPTSSSR